MNYFNEGCKLLLNDFADFCKQCDEDFDVEHVKTLIIPFLKSQQITVTEVSTPKNTTLTTTGGVSPAVKCVPAKPTKTTSKSAEISVDDFNKLSISEITSTWSNNRILVGPLKDLCTKLGLPVNKLTKSQLIDSLLKYKTNQEGASIDKLEIVTSLTAEEEVLPEKQKPKRRVIASAIQKPTITIIRQHDLNLVFCDNEDVILVLSNDNQLCGFIPKESFNKNDTPSVLSPTKNILLLAKNMGIQYEVPETIE
jgi:hypothetical protein